MPISRDVLRSLLHCSILTFCFSTIPAPSVAQQQGPTFSAPVFGSTDDQPALRVSPQSLTIVPGEPHTLRLTDTSGNSVLNAVWTVANPSIAQVKSGGRITVVGLSPGRTTLTALWQEATVQVQVRVLGSLSAASSAGSTSDNPEDLPAYSVLNPRDPFPKRFPNSVEGQPEWHYNRGLDLFEAGDLEGALVEYTKALRMRPAFHEAQTKLAYTLYWVHEFDRAFEAANKALQLDPQSPEAEKTLGLALAGRGDWRGAVRHYMRALQLKPDYVDVYRNLGIALWEVGDQDGSLWAYREAVRRDPDFFEAHFELAGKLRLRGWFAEAVAEIREAVRLRPNDVNSLINLGNNLHMNGQLDEAVKYYRAAIEIQDGIYQAHYGLGATLFKLQAYHGAAFEAVKAIEARPTSVDAWCNLGAAKSRLGLHEEALAAYKRAVEIAPDHYRAKGLYERELERFNQSGTP